MTEQQWRDRWDAQRMFVTADGEMGKAGGNETIRVDEAGQLRIKTPAARVAARQAVRYDISYDPERDRWYLDASWAITPEPPTSLEELRAGPVLGAGRPRSADVASDWRSGDGRQDPAPDSGPLGAHHRPGPTVTAAMVAGATVPAHRHTCHEVSRFTGKHPPPAANTVRAAQDTLLLTNQER
jgi:hypothetical protein